MMPVADDRELGHIRNPTIRSVLVPTKGPILLGDTPLDVARHGRVPRCSFRGKDASAMRQPIADPDTTAGRE
jgi:hypothetical protein